VAKHACVHNKGEFSLSEIFESIKNKPDFSEVGAFGVFVGVVRGKSVDGDAVRKLQVEAYEEEADKVLNDICEELGKGVGIVDVQIHHFVGEFNVSEELVYVVVAGAHRTDVFPVLREAVERFKKQTPIWKKEHLESGKSYWVSERRKTKTSLS